MRLQKFLADKGVASRRAAEKMISEGRVTVNGRTESVLGTKIDPERDQVQVDGAPVCAGQLRRYIMLYKPAGYICSVRDERKRRTVLDLLPEVEERIYPIGR
ncbi:MAG: rRNA pseudouridine synthase, partial [Firmicutes bacterium]|nr:rRNA pseudouridine synthase [Bacillota bacterium]